MSAVERLGDGRPPLEALRHRVVDRVERDHADNVSCVTALVRSYNVAAGDDGPRS